MRPLLLTNALPCLAAAALACFPGRARAEAPAQPLVVVLDPGHGGAHPHEGAHGPKGLIEKDVALAVSQKMKAALEAAGATVVLTRETDEDLPLPARAMAANEAQADLFLSIHCNSMATAADRRTTQGVETYFLSPDPTNAEAKYLAELENGGPGATPISAASDPVNGLLADLALGQARNDSAELARLVQRTLVHSLGAQSRGVRQAPFLVLSGVKMPAALVEIGFISHPAEGRRLGKDAYQQKVAEALAVAVRDFADHVLSRRLFAQGGDAVRAASGRSAAPAVARVKAARVAPAASVRKPAPLAVPALAKEAVRDARAGTTSAAVGASRSSVPSTSLSTLTSNATSPSTSNATPTSASPTSSSAPAPSFAAVNADAALSAAEDATDDDAEPAAPSPPVPSVATVPATR